MDRARIAEIVLEAAALHVNDDGAQAVSIAALAAATEIDEAEIRAIFPDEAALVKATVARIYAAFLASVEAGVGDDDAPGAFTRAYARAAGDDDERDDFTRLGAALLGSGPYRPELVESVRAEQATLRAAFEADGIDPVTAAIVRLAADGLRMNALFSLEPVTPERRRQVIARLVEMARPPDAADPPRGPLAGVGEAER